MTKPKHRKLPEEKRRADIIAAARVLFSRKGFERTRMDDVALMAGLTKGGLYFHFKNKRQLMEAVIANRVQIMEDHLADLLANPQEPEEGLRATFEVFIAELIENMSLAEPDSEGYYPGPLEIFMEGHKMLADSTLVAGFFRGVRGHIANLVQAGKSQGLFPHADPEAASIMAMGLMEGVYMQYGFDPTAFDLMEMGSKIFDQFLRGLKV